MSEFLNPTPFLIEGFDGATPLQAYCSVKTPDFMIVDSIYPLENPGGGDHVTRSAFDPL